MFDQWQRASAVIQLTADRWLSFESPLFVLAAAEPAAVRAVVADVERLTRDKALHAVGYLAYEAGASFGLAVHPGSVSLPLAWFALFARAEEISGPQIRTASGYQIGDISASIGRGDYHAGFARIREHLAAGDTYQANYTFKTSASFAGDARALFADLVEAQRGRYSAFLDLGDRAICSASPELFFRLEGPEIVVRPMKGTVRRGRTLAEDEASRAALLESPKQRAENVMIVDMMRNDLGRIAEVGSVAVPELFSAERYPNVWQMTSTVRARSLASLPEIVAALHPSASVTGAPKMRTMQILAEVEGQPRGVYTGAIGYVPPDGNAQFNVAIRTAVVDRRTGVVEFGVGSGVVWDSEADAEYDECLLKGGVLGRRAEPFALLETLRWTAEEGYFLGARHLARLQSSAEYFAYPLDLAEVRRALDAAVTGVSGPQRVRLLVASDGAVRVETAPVLRRQQPQTVAFAAEPVDSSDTFLFHKTTRRAVYEKARAARPGVDEVLLWNERGDVTEATTANLVVETAGGKVTPPVESGLLAGTFRAELLERGEIREAVVRREDLRSAKAIWLINSVHEWLTMRLEPW
jgi:para-aminobenzoate synthetase/4-amino-4-deoxychorismate lyase